MKKYQMALLTVILLAAPLCLGQSTNQGAIVGTISDINGGVRPSAQIVVLNVETRIARTVTTDERGNYSNYNAYYVDGATGNRLLFFNKWTNSRSAAARNKVIANRDALQRFS
jgi:hypothetical protein